MTKQPRELTLPAVKGRMGERDYFVTAMPLKEVATRVQLAKNISTQVESISERLQRDIKDARINSISKYLLENEQRFFNALVVGVFGDPKWRSFKKLNPEAFNEHTDSLGFLVFSGEEKMYALDGQHRLRGISVALEENKSGASLLSGVDESVSVVFIAHNHQEIANSRRLFVVLNKNAKTVSKRDIIFLDEDDAAAIITRELIEKEGGIYSKETRINISVSSGNTMPIDEPLCYTTVGAFYDCLNILFKDVFSDKKTSSSPKSEDMLDALLNNTEGFFNMLVKEIPALGEYFSAVEEKDISNVCKKHRNSGNGGHLLFRPDGLKVFVATVCAVYKNNHSGNYDQKKMEAAIKRAAKLPLLLNKEPAINLIWDNSSKKISKEFPLLKDVYRHMLNIPNKKITSGKLLDRYKNATGNLKAKLPNKLKI